MGMIPVNSNVQSKTCPEQISSNCIVSAVPAAACLNICAGASITDVEYAQNNALCGLLNELDLTGIDLGCLYQANNLQYTCPVGQEFVLDPAVNIGGTGGYCQTVAVPHAATTAVPVLTSVPNPTPAPTTLKGILELMISKIPCCDPCAKGVNTGG